MTIFKKLLIANRGEIACRVIRTAKRLGIGTVAVFSDADRDALHVRMADEACHIGASASAESYLSIDKILSAAKMTGADALHPGYGFLSEKAAFVTAVEEAGITFVGPPPNAVEAMGDKITAKKLASAAGVSVVPGHLGVIETPDDLVDVARMVGYPVMIKASAGGGGKGMRVAWTDDEAREGYRSSKNEAKGAFGDDRLFVEKFITEPRHIEIQILGDKQGNLLYLGERECSIQRRNQKVIEEAPSPFLDEDTRRRMGEQAVALGKVVGYHSAGTVEFIVDRERNFYFLEMNTRLQVEHPVTELITGFDLVEEMIRVAAGERLRKSQDDVKLRGWAIESRVYAEDPYRNFMPSIGRITRYRPPEEPGYSQTVVRTDTGVEAGSEISVYYDPMIAKLCVWGPARTAATDAMRRALDDFEVEGVRNNLPFLAAIVAQPRFREGDLTTNYIAEAFPDGFRGVDLDTNSIQQLAAVAAHIDRVLRDRASQISGQLVKKPRAELSTRVAKLSGHEISLHDIRGADGQTEVSFADAKQLVVRSDWTPGETHSHFAVNDIPLGIRVDVVGNSIRLRHSGSDVVAVIRAARVAELAALMPARSLTNAGKSLRSPMPGILASLSVVAGQRVEAGQIVAAVEAMKMENVLGAERDGLVKSVPVEVGAILVLDQTILEFA